MIPAQKSTTLFNPKSPMKSQLAIQKDIELQVMKIMMTMITKTLWRHWWYVRSIREMMIDELCEQK